MSQSALAPQRFPVIWVALLAFGLVGAIAAGAMSTGAEAVPYLWIGMVAAAAFGFVAIRGDLLTAVLAWFTTLILLHEEFWRDAESAFFALTIPRIGIVALFVLFLFMVVTGRVRPRLTWPVGWLLLAIVAYFSISAAFSGFETRSPITIHYRLIGGYVFPFVVFLLVLHGLRNETDYRHIAVFFAGLGFYLTFIAWCERFEIYALIFPRFITDPGVGIHWGRVRGPFVMSPAMGLALIYCFFSNLVLARQSRLSIRTLLWLCKLLMLPAIFWTKTRSVWLSFVVCGAIWLICSKRRIARAVTVPALLAVALVVAVANMEGILSEDRDKGGVTDLEPILLRIGLAQMTWHMVADHPLTGVGFGHFRDHAPDFAQDPSSPYYAFSSTAMEHNNLLSVLAETGFIGLALYVTAIVSLIVISIRLYRKLPAAAPGFINRDLLVLYWILAAAFLIDGFFRETSDNPFANCLFFGLSGVIAALNILLGPKPIRAKVGYPAIGATGVRTEHPAAARLPVRVTSTR